MTVANAQRDSGAVNVAMRAQDHRESRARVYRRQDAGETVQTCHGCGCETDIPTPAHAVSCIHGARVDRDAAKPNPGRPQKFDGTKAKAGYRLSAHERNLDGSFSVGELERRERERLELTPTRAECFLCAQAGVVWRVEGTQAVCRAAFEAHRAEHHPRAISKRRSFRKPAAGKTTIDDGDEPVDVDQDEPADIEETTA